jgi:hypothetical protein
MNYPINFDFGKHWQTRIVPHLDNHDLGKSIKEGVNDYSTIKRYRANTVPALYSSTDYYATLMERKEELLIEQLRKANKLPARYLKLEKQIEEAGEFEFDLISQLDHKILKTKREIFKPYLGWDAIKYNLESCILYNGCHSWAPTFELTLAKLVEPEEEWYVRKSERHSTVINKSHTKVFDLLRWADRIENYMFGDPLKPDVANDITFGGKNAFIDSSNDQVN